MNRKERKAYTAILAWGKAVTECGEADEARAALEDTGAIVTATDEEAEKMAQRVQKADEALEKAKDAMFTAVDELPLKLAVSEAPIWRLAMLYSAGYTVGNEWESDRIWDWTDAISDQLHTAVQTVLGTE